jgi:hypothetical protein
VKLLNLWKGRVAVGTFGIEKDDERGFAEDVGTPALDAFRRLQLEGLE